MSWGIGLAKLRINKDHYARQIINFSPRYTMPILRPKLTFLAAVLLGSLYWTERVAADCECGYLVSSGQGTSLFTNSILTDFTDSSLNDIGSDWQRANWGISSQPNNNPPLLAQYYSPGNVYRNAQGLAIETQAYSGGGTVYGGRKYYSLHEQCYLQI